MFEVVAEILASQVRMLTNSQRHIPIPRKIKLEDWIPTVIKQLNVIISRSERKVYTYETYYVNYFSLRLSN